MSDNKYSLKQFGLLSMLNLNARDLLLDNSNDINIDDIIIEDKEEQIPIDTSPHAFNIPFKESRTAFYYNQKINCMTADGEVSYKDGSYSFSKDNTFGLLDWGRGVWPFHNEWYWSNGTGYVNGKIFGFNLGCGFGNPEHGTENVIFYGDEVIKLYNVVIKHEEDYMKPWHIYDDEKKVDLVLTPTYDRTTKVKLLWVDNCCHQMFGEFTGYVTLNDGRRLDISNVIAFAEHAVNNW